MAEVTDSFFGLQSPRKIQSDDYFSCKKNQKMMSHTQSLKRQLVISDAFRRVTKSH